MDNAFERARAAYGTGAYDDATLEFLFPQLKESEDERIRKALIDMVKRETGFTGFPSQGQVLAYLEKQKDASKAIEAVERIDKYIDEHLANAHDMKDSDPDKKYYRGWDDALGKMSGILQDVYSGEKQKEHQNNSDAQEKALGRDLTFPLWEDLILAKRQQDKDMNLDEIAQDYVNGVKEYNPEPTWDLIQTAVCYGYHYREQKEQKPAEWSEEDELMLTSIISTLKLTNGAAQMKIDWLNNRVKSLRLQPKEEWNKEDEKMISDLVGVFEGKVSIYTLPAKKYAKRLKFLCPQPKREWGEEDEKHRQWILECLADGKRKVPEFAEQYQAAFNWLNSLRPSWKPSEEQMNALKNSAYGTYQNGDGPALRELYEQLKKLM